ncbi:conserved hypothetical protein [Hyella patelloides LEGE 07179]|uniref:DNA topoisomerase (ATP-hydrolyzing) n=1 Tax=Hyella patelloides LEGE 07179 TaxID=945734 RepID=A0A563VLM5_9CYAN|nr:hypothetical protein [Hyella patelloides]VEP12322.1 conserved hypothetical protein [Hyella patelloides LEGE 07179]
MTQYQPTQKELIESIRRRPGMFFGSVGERGVEQFIYELVANIIDRFLVDEATFVKVTIQDSTITVIDDALGFPFDEPSRVENISLATEFLTNFHFTPSKDGHSPHIHLVGNGGGIAPINIASSQLTIKSWRNGLLWSQSFVRGIAQNNPTIIEQGNGKGTAIELIPDAEIFGISKPRLNVIRKALFEIAHLFSGLKVYFQEECFFAPEGLEMLGSLFLDPPIPYRIKNKPFHLKLQQENMFIEVAAFEDVCEQKKVLSWVNGIRTFDNGSHVEGFLEVLQQVEWNPQLILIHVIMYKPVFAYPMKTKLDVPSVKDEVKQALLKPLQNYLMLAKETNKN